MNVEVVCVLIVVGKVIVVYDVSDGGLFVVFVEMVMVSGFGVDIVVFDVVGVFGED